MCVLLDLMFDFPNRLPNKWLIQDQIGVKVPFLGEDSCVKVVLWSSVKSHPPP